MSLPLYGVLTKTLYTAQAHFAARHASVKHKNKLTENALRAVYPRRPCGRKENKRITVPPLLRRFLWPKFRVRPGEQYRPSVCLFDPCLIYQAPRRITVGIQRCEAAKFVAFRRSSTVGLIPSWMPQTSQSVRFGSGFESPLLGPPRSIRCCFCSFNCEVFSLSGQIEARRS